MLKLCATGGQRSDLNRIDGVCLAIIGDSLVKRTFTQIRDGASSVSSDIAGIQLNCRAVVTNGLIEFIRADIVIAALNVGVCAIGHGLTLVADDAGARGDAAGNVAGLAAIVVVLLGGGKR